MIAHAEDEDDKADRDTWTTPAWLTRLLGWWDLDPCSNARSSVRARRTFALDPKTGEQPRDGLAMAPFVAPSTRVFCNPPYSRGNVLRFVSAYVHTNFCFLLRLDTSTAWYRKLWRYTELLVIPKRRIAFDPPPGVVDAPGPRFPHGLFFRRADDATDALLAASFPVRKFVRYSPAERK